MGDVGAPELLIILAVVLLLFGGKKLPEFARSLGKAKNEFQKGVDEGMPARGRGAHVPRHQRLLRRPPPRPSRTDVERARTTRSAADPSSEQTGGRIDHEPLRQMRVVDHEHHRNQHARRRARADRGQGSPARRRRAPRSGRPASPPRRRRDRGPTGRRGPRAARPAGLGRAAPRRPPDSSRRRTRRSSGAGAAATTRRSSGPASACSTAPGVHPLGPVGRERHEHLAANAVGPVDATDLEQVHPPGSRVSRRTRCRPTRRP